MPLALHVPPTATLERIVRACAQVRGDCTPGAPRTPPPEAPAPPSAADGAAAMRALRACYLRARNKHHIARDVIAKETGIPAPALAAWLRRARFAPAG